MKKEEKAPKKKKLVLRRDSIRTLDTKDLSAVSGGGGFYCEPYPPDAGAPPQLKRQ